MKEATYVAISTQKGGAGKTTLTVLVASYLHYVKGYNVAVVDCDFPQYSIHDMRKRDMKAVMEDGHYKVLAYEQLKRLKKNPYPIRCSRAEDAIRTAENLVEAQPDLDFVHRRPCGDGEFHQVRHCHQRTDDKHGQVRHQRDLSRVEHGGRTRKDRTIQGIRQSLCRVRPAHSGNIPAGQQAFPQGDSGRTQGCIPFHGIPCGQNADTRQQP